MNTTMTKREVRTALGLPTDAALARYFGISKGATNQWPEDEPIPEGRQWELRCKRPDLFVTPADAAGGHPHP